MGKEERKKSIQIGKEVKLFVDDTILCIENTMEFAHTLILELINEFSKIAEYKVDMQKSIVFLLAINNI